MNTEQIIGMVLKMDEQELKDINEIILHRLKKLRDKKTSRMRKVLEVGDVVSYQSSKSDDEIMGIITKIARVKAIVDCGSHGMWRVPLSMLNPK